MRKVTVEQIMDWKPCPTYTEEHVKTLVGEGKNPIELLDLAIPARHRVWAGLRCLSFVDRLMAIAAFAERVLLSLKRNCPEMWPLCAAIRTTRLVAMGEMRRADALVIREIFRFSAACALRAGDVKGGSAIDAMADVIDAAVEGFIPLIPLAKEGGGAEVEILRIYMLGEEE